MSVTARLALAMLALGHDLHHAAPVPVSEARPMSAAKLQEAASVIADLAEAWLEGTQRERSTPETDPLGGDVRVMEGGRRSGPGRLPEPGK